MNLESSGCGVCFCRLTKDRAKWQTSLGITHVMRKCWTLSSSWSPLIKFGGRSWFLWRDRGDVKGGHCLNTCPKVTRPPELGGLVLTNLRLLGWELQVRWLWLQKTEPSRPWASFSIQAHPSVQDFFSMSVTTEVGDGKIPCGGTNGPWSKHCSGCSLTVQIGVQKVCK